MTRRQIFEFLPDTYHKQAVERCVELVTEAFASIVGSDRKDGFIKARNITYLLTSKSCNKTNIKRGFKYC